MEALEALSKAAFDNSSKQSLPALGKSISQDEFEGEQQRPMMKDQQDKVGTPFLPNDSKDKALNSSNNHWTNER